MSDETKHTPGPWLIDGRTVYALHDDGDDSVNRFWATVFGLKCPRAEVQANAQLMWAAPDLLEACRPVLAEAKEKADYLHDSWNPDAHVELTLTISELRAIHAAVTKATGTK